PDKIIITNNNLKLLSSIILEDNTFGVNDTILNSILLNTQVPVNERIKIFVLKSQKFDLSFIHTFLSNLGGIYAWITDTSSKARIPRENDNWLLLNVLVNKGYLSSFT